MNVLNKQEKKSYTNVSVKTIFKKNQELGQEWFRNQMLMRIIHFWVFIIFHECVHRSATHSPCGPVK